jgi:hypothetical protein
MLSPQIRGTFFHQCGADVATCALGAAFVASGMKVTERFRRWPILRVVVPPAELPRELRARSCPLRVFEAIIALNDQVGWTRTMISDWLEMFESRHPEGAEQIAPVDQSIAASFDFTGHSDGDPEDDLAAVSVR